MQSLKACLPSPLVVPQGLSVLHAGFTGMSVLAILAWDIGFFLVLAWYLDKVGVSGLR